MAETCALKLFIILRLELIVSLTLTLVWGVTCLCGLEFMRLRVHVDWPVVPWMQPLTAGMLRVVDLVERCCPVAVQCCC